MADIAQCLTAFAQLSKDDRERCLQLIGAYNEAVAESRTDNPQSGGDPFPLFSHSEIEDLVGDYGSNRLSNIRPAMTRYLLLLERGYRWPALV